jgi:hypothetical protein
MAEIKVPRTSNITCINYVRIFLQKDAWSIRRLWSSLARLQKKRIFIISLGFFNTPYHLYNLFTLYFVDRWGEMIEISVRPTYIVTKSPTVKFLKVLRFLKTSVNNKNQYFNLDHTLKYCSVFYFSPVFC